MKRRNGRHVCLSKADAYAQEIGYHDQPPRRNLGMLCEVMKKKINDPSSAVSMPGSGKSTNRSTCSPNLSDCTEKSNKIPARSTKNRMTTPDKPPKHPESCRAMARL